MSKSVKNYMQLYGKNWSQRQNRNVTKLLILEIPFEAYLARCGPWQNMQT